jgi:hypothetical protein
VGILNYFSKLSQRFTEEPKGILFYAANLSSLFFAACLFFSSLYSIQDSIIYFVSFHDRSSSAVSFDSLAGLGIEQTIIFLIEALRYQFWIFFCLLLRHMVLFNKNWWSFILRFLWLIAAIVFVTIYMNWNQRLYNSTLMSSSPFSTLNFLVLSLFVPLVWDVVIIIFLFLGKPFEKSTKRK